jgi:multiple sugar transport system substrate-binding protein
VGFLPQDPGWWPWIFCEWFGRQARRWPQGSRSPPIPATSPPIAWIQSLHEGFYGLDNVKLFSSEFGPWASPSAPFFTGKIAMVFQGVFYDNYIQPV